MMWFMPTNIIHHQIKMSKHSKTRIKLRKSIKNNIQVNKGNS